MSNYTVTLDHDLYPGDLIGLAFIDAAKSLEGDLTYGDTTAVGDFSYPTDATLSTMLSEAKSFWNTGIKESAGGSAVQGFSSTTPREFFDCFISTGGETGTWRYANGTQVSGRNYALALHGWYAVYGYDAKASDVWGWLAATTSSAALETDAETPPALVAMSTTGVYSPAVALPTRIDTATGSNATSLYEWATVGLLAELRSAQDASNFTAAKDAMSTSRRRFPAGTPHDDTFDMPAIRGRTGLTFQTYTTEVIEGASRRAKDVASAAMAALAYREAPRIYAVKDHNPRH